MNAPETIKLFMVRLDGGTQSRASLSESTIDEYTEAIANGATFPPVTIFHDEGNYWLSDGFHRFHAHQRSGRGSIACDIRQGTRRDAVLFSAVANVEHGLRRTNEDKRRAVMTLLGDNEWREWSDREIARRCGVSDRFVNGLRANVANRSQIERKYERGGSVYTMNTAGIGVRSPEDRSALLAEERAPEAQTATIRHLAEPKASTAEPLERAAERPAESTARPLRNLENLSGGELARWIKITTPENMAHRIRVLRMAADILEDEMRAALAGESTRMGETTH